MIRSFLGLGLLLLLATAQADFQQEVDQVFNSLTNTTAPGAHALQRRGVLSGGSIVSRSRIMNTAPISLVPPSFGAGCGGIDLYGGSFSFINQSQFTTLMRSIAGNASGYAFQLAINAMCPDCGSVMTDLQRKIQQFNQQFSNSCQLAQGVVNDTVRAFDAQNQSRMSNASVSQGITDVFGSFGGQSVMGDPLAQLKKGSSAALQSEIQGNLIWRALQGAHAEQWSTLDQTGGLLETMMSVSGTLIVGPPRQSADGRGENVGLTSLPALISLHELLEGGSDPAPTRLYRCDTQDQNGCLAPKVVTQPVKGLKTRIDHLLMGEDGQSGLLGKFTGSVTTPLTREELAFMELVPTAIGGMIRNLAREDAGIARIFIREASPIIALELAEDLIQGLWKAVEASTALGNNTYLPLLKMHLESVRKDLDHEYQVLSGRFGNSQSLMRFYQDLMASLPPRRYPLPGGPSTSSSSR